MGYKPYDKIKIMAVFKDSTDKFHTKKFTFEVRDPKEIYKRIEKEKNTRKVYVRP